jgi:hypothetical protein
MNYKEYMPYETSHRIGSLPFENGFGIQSIAIKVDYRYCRKLSSLLGVVIRGITIETVERPVGRWWFVRRKGPYNYSHVEN